MDNKKNNLEETIIDTKRVEAFSSNFLTLANSMNVYSKNHPALTPVTERFMTSLHKLRNLKESIKFEFFKDVLKINNIEISSKNNALISFREFMYQREIESLIYSQKVSQTDILKFMKIISENSKTLREKGGVGKLFFNFKIKSIIITQLNFNKLLKKGQIRSEALVNKFLLDVKQFKNTSLYKFLSGIDYKLKKEEEELLLLANKTELIIKTIVLRLVETYEFSDIGSQVDSLLKSFQIMKDFIIIKDSEEVNMFIKMLAFSVKFFKKEISDEIIKRGFFNSNNEKILTDLFYDLPNDIMAKFIFSYLIEKKTFSKVLIESLKKILKQKKDRRHILTKINKDFSVLISKKDVSSDLKELASGWKKAYKILSFEKYDRFIPVLYNLTLREIENFTKKDEFTENLSLVNNTIFLNSIKEVNISSSLLDIYFCIIDNEDDFKGYESILFKLKDLLSIYLKNQNFTLTNKLLTKLIESSGNSLARQSKAIEMLDSICTTDILGNIFASLGEVSEEKLQKIINTFKLLGQRALRLLISELKTSEDMAARYNAVLILQSAGASIKSDICVLLDDKRWYVVRNAITILGNLNDNSILAKFGKFTNHPDSRIRSELVKSLRNFKTPEALELLKILLSDRDPNVSRSVISAVGQFENNLLENVLFEIISLEGMKKYNKEVIFEAMEIIGKKGLQSSLPILKKYLTKNRWSHYLGDNDMYKKAVALKKKLVSG